MQYVFDDFATDAAKVWLQTAYADMERQPISALFSNFSRSQTAFIINQAQDFVRKVFDWRGQSSAQQVDQQSFHKTKSAVYLYYRVLQGVLRGDTPTGARMHDDRVIQDIVSNTSLQFALLTCAVEVVAFVWGTDDAFPSLTLRLGRLRHMLELFQATEHFKVHLARQPGLDAMPCSLESFLGWMRLRIVEEVAWQDGSTLYDFVLEAADHDCVQPADRTELLDSFLSTVSAVALGRLRTICAALQEGQPNTTAHAAAAVFDATAAAILAESLSHHLHLFFGQHMLNVIVCSIYAASRVLNATIPFKRIIQAASQAFPHQGEALFKCAELRRASSPGAEAEFGDTRRLYNDVFLPEVQDFLLSWNVPETVDLAASQQPPAALPASAVVKKQPSAGRLPLQSLSAADMNIRARRQGNACQG